MGLFVPVAPAAAVALHLSTDCRVMASELTPNVSLREAAFLQPPNLATFILGQVVVAARHRRISFYKILAIAWPARKEECSSRCRFHWCTSEWHGGMEKLSDPKQLVIHLCNQPTEESWYEFKVNKFDPVDVGEYVSAIANSAMLAEQRYGYMIFGVEDTTHDIVGTSVRLKSAKFGGELFSNYLNRLLYPNIYVEFCSCLIQEKHVEIILIEPTYHCPVKFKNVAYIRNVSSKTRLDNQQEKERRLWLMTNRHKFEDGIAIPNQSSYEIWKNFHCRDLAKMMFDVELADQVILEKFISTGLIVDNLQGGYDVTNLFALAAAKDLSKFNSVSGKAPRVIVYKGENRETAIKDQDGKYGYALAFVKLLDFVMAELEGPEYFEHGVRKKAYRHPSIAIREFLANALVHQDLVATGYGPRVEIFSNKLRITNPGTPLIEPIRFVDAPARSRNVKLAKLMRDCKLCEERGSGVGRALRAIEANSQSAPLFETIEDSTVITLYANNNFRDMSANDRTRACFQHAQLMYQMHAMPITNQSLRKRLGLTDNQSAHASHVINDTIAGGWIKPLYADQAKKNAKYVPFYVE